MKFSVVFSLASLLAACAVTAAPAERAHEAKARVNLENGIKKRGSGKLTWYAGGMLDSPACGGPRPGDDDLIVAVAKDGGYASCNQKVRLHYQGKHLEATVRDYCEDCQFGHFDGTKGLFRHFAGLEQGILTGVDYELL